jgi:hypothetical protein
MGLMQLVVAYAGEITKMVEYVDRKEDSLIQTVRRHLHHINLAVLQTARHLKTEVQKGTRQIKDNTPERQRERERYGEGRGSIDKRHVTYMKSWWIMNSHING